MPQKIGMTQESLAEKGYLTPLFISYAETGKRAIRVDNIMRIAMALDISVDYLLKGDLVDKDLLILLEKLSRLVTRLLWQIETIIDEHVTLTEE